MFIKSSYILSSLISNEASEDAPTPGPRSTAVSDASAAPAQTVSVVSVNFTYFFTVMLPAGPIKYAMLIVVTTTTTMIMP